MMRKHLLPTTILVLLVSFATSFRPVSIHSPFELLRQQQHTQLSMFRQGHLISGVRSLSTRGSSIFREVIIRSNLKSGSGDYLESDEPRGEGMVPGGKSSRFSDGVILSGLRRAEAILSLTENDQTQLSDSSIPYKIKNNNNQFMTDGNGSSIPKAVGNLFKATRNRVSDTIAIESDSFSVETKDRVTANTNHNKVIDRHPELQLTNLKNGPKKKSYLKQPTVTLTALAHDLWSSVIQPHDTVIDATCGNGHDSFYIGSILFSSEKKRYQADSDIKPELICIDIQQRAISNTIDKLENLDVPDDLWESNAIRVVQTSHSPLPAPKDDRSVGLVCYNLGYLPGDSSKDSMCTTLESSVYSLADAALLIRKGGLISVMTYPGSNLLEATAVEVFMEGLGLFSSREGRWEDVLEYFDETDGKQGELVKRVVEDALRRVWEESKGKMSWRVFLHRPLGRELSPCLITATRIK